MSDLGMSSADLAEMFGGEAQQIAIDTQELEVGLVLRSIREQLLDITEKDKVGTVKLAGRLGIAPSAVSRFLGGESDMKVSTVVLYARALGHHCAFSLVPDPSCAAYGNHRRHAVLSTGIENVSTATSGSMTIMSVDSAPRWAYPLSISANSAAAHE
jgi:hypothetical protein